MVNMQILPLTSTTGKPLRVCLWQGENTGKNTVVQLVHGMAEHMDRYDRAAQALCAAGYVVIGHDHLGHGPLAKAEEHGFFADKDGWGHLVEDIYAVHGEARRRFPKAKFVLFGHSMGSFAVREYLLCHGVDLAACAISGTGWYPAPLCFAARTAAALCGVFGGWKKPAPLVNAIAFSGNNKPFEYRTGFEWLSRDEKEVDKYVTDPLCGFLFTARGYYDMFTGLQGISKVSRLSVMKKETAVYFMSGDCDPVGQNGKGVETVAAQFRNAGMRDVTVKLYPGGRHELLNETNRDEVTRELIAWLDAHI